MIEHQTLRQIHTGDKLVTIMIRIPLTVEKITYNFNNKFESIGQISRSITPYL